MHVENSCFRMFSAVMSFLASCGKPHVLKKAKHLEVLISRDGVAFSTAQTVISVLLPSRCTGLAGLVTTTVCMDAGAV
jgi:hypothetical protein